MSFWDTLKKPIMALAPMADVTDAAFRRIIAKYGKPDLMFTEFVSADGLMRSDAAGREKLMRDLLFDETERPIVAQFFTAHLDMMEKAAGLARELGFDGVDINMGCPDRSIEKQGAGAALMKNPKRARELIIAAKRGAGELPVSIKTRIGYNKNEIEVLLPELLAENPAAISIHARTRKEMSSVPAHWDVVSQAVQIRNEAKSKTLILGNGDILSLDGARQKAKETEADGVMLGRAIFGNPFLFSNLSLSAEALAEADELENKEPADFVKQKLQVMVEHTKLFEELLGGVKNFSVMKKHYKAYANGFDGAKELRARLMETNNAEEVETTVSEFLHDVS